MVLNLFFPNGRAPGHLCMPVLASSTEYTTHILRCWLHLLRESGGIPMGAGRGFFYCSSVTRSRPLCPLRFEESKLRFEMKKGKNIYYIPIFKKYKISYNFILNYNNLEYKKYEKKDSISKSEVKIHKKLEFCFGIR